MEPDTPCCEGCGKELGDMTVILADYPMLFLCFSCLAKVMHKRVAWPVMATEVIQ
jgi:hypothetical protein